VSRAAIISGAVSATAIGIIGVAAPANAAVANGTCGNLQNPIHVQHLVHGVLVVNVWESSSSDFVCWKASGRNGVRISGSLDVVKRNIDTGRVTSEPRNFSGVTNMVGAPWVYRRVITVEVWAHRAGTNNDDSWAKVSLPMHRR
jgi:hypothetical protein